MRQHRGIRIRGFTMVEMMITLVVLSILAGMAAPAMRDFIRRSQATANANTLLTTLATARSEAIRRSGRVTVCPSSDGTSCGGTWKDGWIVFNDDFQPRQVDGQDAVVQSFAAPPELLAFTQTVDQVSFLGSGIRESGSGVPTGNCMEFVVAELEDSRRYVRINAIGSMRTGKGVCS